MLIHEPEIKRKNGQSILSAVVECASSPISLPKTLFYSIPQEYESYLLLRGDVFLTAILLTAMALGEDIEVRAPVSPKLVSGLLEYQKIFSIWLPNLLTPIQINPRTLKPYVPENGHGETASLYTGGVDSSYLLRENLPPHQPIQEMQIKHVITVHGADIPLGQVEYFNKIVDMSRVPLASQGLNLITIHSNARAFTQGLVKWDFTHGSTLLSAGMMLAGFLCRLYIASSYNYRNLIPWGSSPLIDHLLSTETLDIIHYGASMRRVEKMRRIANWKIAHAYFRVCNSAGETGKINCERCDKCLGTKALLEIEGVLEKFTTFTEPFSYRELLRWAWVCSAKTLNPRFVFQQTILKKRWEFLPFVILVLISQRIKYWVDLSIPDNLRTYLRNRFLPLGKNPFHTQR